MIDLAWVFVTGLAGSLHCLGMCGPLVLAYSLRLVPESNGPSAQPRNLFTAGLKHHVLFQAGRITTYVLLGAAAAGMVRLGGLNPSLSGLRTGAVIAGGLVMIFFGVLTLKLIKPVLPFIIPLTQKNGFSARLMRTHLHSRQLSSKWILGFAAGFLPCMFSWAMIVKAAITADVISGAMIMASFGLGTAPALLFTGSFASLFSLRARLAGERIAALSVIVMGLILFVKGVAQIG